MTRNVAASVRQRLLNYARAEGRPFNEVLQYFALERFLYRLGCSPYRHQFVLKGGRTLIFLDPRCLADNTTSDMFGRQRGEVALSLQPEESDPRA